MNIFTDNPDFYPTPDAVIEQMMLGEDFTGKTILEPSAGKGNIVEWLNSNGAGEVIACEKDPNIRRLLAGKCQIIADDFLTVTSEQVSHVSYIVMNPPFSAGAKHILHAYEIAPAGCTVIALCNSSSLSRCERQYQQLQEVVKLYGYDEYLGEVFADDAERRTRCSVSLVKLYKSGSEENEFEGYFFSTYDEDVINLNQSEGIMHYSVVRDLVNRYVSAVKLFDETLAATQKINETATFFDFCIEKDKFGNEKEVKQDYGCLPIRFCAVSYNDRHTVVTHDQYKKALQKYYWRIIFKKLNMEKYATSQLREQINRFIEQQKNVPFTMGNIYRVIDMVVQTTGQRMQRALMEAFDTICSFSAENSTAGEKWKTNANYMVNKRFIVPYICEGYHSYDHEPYPMLNFSYGGNRNEIEDVCKALCWLTGRNYDEIETLRSHEGQEWWGDWFNWGFFKCRGYKKGTMHFEFIDDDIWFKFNYEVSKQRGWSLPKKTEKKPKTPKCKKKSETDQQSIFGEMEV